MGGGAGERRREGVVGGTDRERYGGRFRCWGGSMVGSLRGGVMGDIGEGLGWKAGVWREAELWSVVRYHYVYRRLVLEEYS